MNDTIIKIKSCMDLAWMELDRAIIVSYDDGYSGLTWKLKQIQLQLDNLEAEINDKEFGDDDE